MEAVMWCVTLLSVIGVVLNARARIEGFYFWMVANAAWVAIDAAHGLWAQAVLFMFYFCMCFYGVAQWKVVRRREQGVL